MSIALVYRAALHLYPKSFRREYSEDMVALVVAQLRDESAARVLGRTALDLLVTVPTRHLEAHMSRSSTTAVIVVLVALGLVLAIVGGPVGVLAAAAALAVAALMWTRSRPVVSTGETLWWKLVLGGTALLASLIAATTATGELPSGGWFVAMLAGLTSLSMIATGVVLGITSRPRSAPQARS